MGKDLVTKITELDLPPSEARCPIRKENRIKLAVCIAARNGIGEFMGCSLTKCSFTGRLEEIGVGAWEPGLVLIMYESGRRFQSLQLKT